MRLLFRVFIAVIVAAVLALGAVFFLPGDRVARIAADQLSTMTGRRVEMTGDTTLSFWPVLGISTGATTIANAEWSDEGAMLRAESFKVGVDPLALLRGEVRITGLEAVSPAIILERARDGRLNWEIGVDGVSSTGQADGQGNATTPAAQSSRLALTLDRALITDASVTYIDHADGTRRTMAGNDLDLRWPAYNGEATLKAVLRPAGSDVEIDARVADLGALIEGDVAGLSVSIAAGKGTARFEGRGSAAPALDGTLALDLDDSAAFFAALGMPGVDIPKGLGRSIAATAQVTLTSDMRLALRGLDATLDNNRLTGAADLDLGGAKPVVTARLDAGALDLSALGGADDGGSGGGTPTPASSWSTDPIDASAVGLLDGEIALSADSIDLGTLKFEQARTRTTIDRSRAVFRFEELRGYGGNVTGQFVVNNRSGLSVGGDLDAGDIDMERLLTDAAGITRFATNGQMSLDFLGVGQSMDAIMRSLSGSLSLATGRGVISGFDLDRLMRGGDVTGGTTVVDEMSASFAIADGDMRGDDLTMSLPLASATGRGRIGLGAQDIDYVFTPVLLDGGDFQGLAIPVKIRGPWSDPKIWPDLEDAIDLNFKKEKEKLEKEVREEVEREVNKFVEKELGVTVEEGESVEDAIKKEVEKEVVKELFKLFD